jgi:hypothetical protein
MSSCRATNAKALREELTARLIGQEMTDKWAVQRIGAIDDDEAGE